MVRKKEEEEYSATHPWLSHCHISGIANQDRPGRRRPCATLHFDDIVIGFSVFNAGAKTRPCMSYQGFHTVPLTVGKGATHSNRAKTGFKVGKARLHCVSGGEKKINLKIRRKKNHNQLVEGKLITLFVQCVCMFKFLFFKDLVVQSTAGSHSVSIRPLEHPPNKPSH